MKPNGPGFFHDTKFRNLGSVRRAAAMPPLSPSDIQMVRCERAWLLVDGQRFSALAAESTNDAGNDQEKKRTGRDSGYRARAR